MRFNSLEYAAFLPLAVLAYYAAPQRQRWMVLIVSGAAFLLFLSPVHLAIALAITTVNFYTGLGLEKWADSRRGSLLLWFAILFDVGCLGWFKYGNALFGGSNILLPVGISYYAFQCIGYNLEIHWGRQRAATHPGRFASSVLFFPKLLAGPIERPHHFLAQLDSSKRFSTSDLASGLKQIGWGLFIKCVLADRIALVIDPVLDGRQEFNGLLLLACVFFYTVQVYCDFSGYTDIALGSARLMGIELIPNFDHPFAARSVTEFWRRWHISLSSWTNDYVFKPLSMYISFKTNWRRAGMVFSILVTFVVLGAWHGPRWTYVVFGLIHGCAVSAEALTQKARRAALARMPPWLGNRLSNVATIVFYSFSCVFFRARTISDALYVLGHSFRRYGSTAGVQYFAETKRYQVALVLLLLAAIAVVRRVLGNSPAFSERLAQRSAWVRWPIYYAVIVGIIVLGVFEVNQFVYSQF